MLWTVRSIKQPILSSEPQDRGGFRRSRERLRRAPSTAVCTLRAAAGYRQSARQSRQTCPAPIAKRRSEEHTSELQSLMRISYAVFCLKKKKINRSQTTQTDNQK